MKESNIQLKVELENDFLYIFKYSDGKRFIVILAFLFMFIMGLFFILIGNWFTIFFGSILIFVSLLNAIDICFFKALIINDNFLIKEWYLFGKRSIKISNLSAVVAKRLWSGTIFFREKNDAVIGGFLMNFEVFPIGNSGFKQIKKILIEKQVIKGDENEWNY